MDPFVPVDASWTPVSPALARARRISLGLVCLVILGGLALVAALSSELLRTVALLAIAATLVVSAWSWWYIGRRVRSWGYALRDADLIVTSGIMFRRLVIVPYGRMQLVDVVAGPIDRMCGISTVQLHTAAATTDAQIPGLAPEVAAHLRDQLARLGELRTAGL